MTAYVKRLDGSGVDDHFFYDPLVALLLPHVSSRWRSVARSNQLLWKDMHPVHTDFASLSFKLAVTLDFPASFDVRHFRP
ncbi:hypothetical protein M422DRAFT_26334 [Sphaerobolus stellatus SS14]|nr:hypothetical protein M422DRAFT_26334 [Sphaerobolus stellatus SS14]